MNTLLLSVAVVLAAGGVAGYWGADNRLVLGFTDSQGRHYPRGPPLATEYHYPDGEVSNQIARQPPVPPATYSSRSGWRHRTPHHDKTGHQGKPRNRKHNNKNNNNHNHQINNALEVQPSGVPSVYRTKQWGSVRIPYRGATVNVPRLESTQKTYRGSMNSSVSQRKVQPRQGEWYLQDAPATDLTIPCIRCPDDRAVVANRGREQVVVEQPELKTCHHSARFKLHELRMEWIHGPKPGTLAEEGSHVMVGRLMYRHKQLQVCRMKYAVIVRKCPPLVLPKYMIAHCSKGNIWGSKCQLSCYQGFQLKGHEVVECVESLEWSHPVPYCEAITGCPLPMSPEHGRLSCKTTGEGNEYLLPENTECRYVCDPGYAIPDSQSNLSVISCQSGGWNSTVDPSCQGIHERQPQAEQPQPLPSPTRHRASRRRHRDHRLWAARRAPDPCQPNPCEEGGTCLRGPRSSVICLCPEHREGEFCERARCSQDKCENGGKCMVLSEETVCFCPPGYSGQHCEVKNSR
ncbi:uncharacterized protein [Anabrus simplex]|uniref:uncharacterized protein n=1 Tax=Anabrus simplex TaxID=316456 RepID=UPI0035A28FA8